MAMKSSKRGFKMIAIGIDPGRQGALCAIDEYGDIFFYLLTDIRAVDRALSQFAPTTTSVYLEKAQAMPKNGAVGMFNYGEGYGILQGLLIAHRLPYTLVPPATWTKDMLMGTKATAKARNVEAARRLQPDLSFVPEGCRKPHLGLVDAYLLAEWGRRRHAHVAQAAS